MARSVAQGKGGIIDVCGVAPARFGTTGCGINASFGIYIIRLFFPRHRAFNRFFPACVTVITLSGFDAWTELALNHRFLLQLVEVLPEANRQAAR